MKNEKEIINKAKQAYESHFQDSLGKTDDAYRGHDVTLDKEKLTEKVEVLKEQEEKKLESLNVLKEKLTVEAEQSLENTFGEEKAASPKQRPTTSQVLDELNEEKKHLTTMVEKMKEEKLAHKK